MPIREARPEDKPFIEEMASLTRGGADYLARVFDEWLEDGGFYALEVDGRVIGTAKLTLSCPERWAGRGAEGSPGLQGQGLREEAPRLHAPAWRGARKGGENRSP